jgi:hypothetical protein
MRFIREYDEDVTSPGALPQSMAMNELAVILHVVFAAAWFGHKLLIPRDVRVSVRHGDSASLLIDRMNRAQRFGIMTGLGTLGTGIWLVYLTTGFADVPLPIYVAFGAVVLMFILGATIARTAWNRIRAAIEANDIPAAAGGVTAFNRVLNLENLLWILALTMMFV